MRIILVATAAAVLFIALDQTKGDVALPGLPAPVGGPFSPPGGLDPLFTFTYSDAAGDVATGMLSAIPSGLGNSSSPSDAGYNLLALSGTLDVTSSANNNWAVGTYSLIPIGPIETTSPNGAFYVDNVLYPNGDAANGVNPGIGNNPSFLTNWGLLFGRGGTEINIWGNGNGDYAFAAGAGAGNYPILVSSGGTFYAVDPPSAPEPSTLTLVGIGLVGLGYSRWRQKNRPPRNRPAESQNGAIRPLIT